MNTQATIKNANAQSQDEALINDLFEQLGGEVELSLDDLVAAEPAAEPAAEIEVDVLDDIENLADEAEFDLAIQDLEDEVEAAPVVEVKKPKKAKKAKAEPKAATTTDEDGEEKEVVKTTQHRVTHYNSKKSEVLLDRLGGDQGMILLEVSDIDLESNALKEKQENLLRILNNQPTVMGTRGNQETVQKKVAEKVIILFTYFKNGGALNKVLRITFETLLKDGYISMGKGGNLFTNLINAHYSEGTARAQSGQMLQMLPLLKIAEKEGGKLVPNEQSLILAKMKAELTVA